MESYPNCNHADCQSLGKRLARPYTAVTWLAGFLAGLAIVASMMLVGHISGQNELGRDLVIFAGLAVVMPVLVSGTIAAASSRFRGQPGWGGQAMANLATLAFLATITLLRETGIDFASATAFNRVFWSIIAGMSGIASGVWFAGCSLLFAEDSQPARRQEVADACPGSQPAEAVAAI